MDAQVVKLAEAILLALTAIEERQVTLNESVRLVGETTSRQQRKAVRNTTAMLREMMDLQREMREELRQLRDRVDAVDAGDSAPRTIGGIESIRQAGQEAGNEP